MITNYTRLVRSHTYQIYVGFRHHMFSPENLLTLLDLCLLLGYSLSLRIINLNISPSLLAGRMQPCFKAFDRLRVDGDITGGCGHAKNHAASR